VVYLFLVKYLKNKKKIIMLIVAIVLISFILFPKNKQLSRVKTNLPSAATTTPIAEDNETEFEEDESDTTDSLLGLKNQQRQSATVIGVRDGDTIEVDLGNGNFKTVRYIGIDTPESVDPRRAVECFGKEASNINNTLVMNKTIQLEKDVSETDKYGRLLRYVFVDNVFVNQYLVQEGFANASAYPPDVKYQEDFNSAEEEARLNGKGLWSACRTNENGKISGSSNPEDKDCSDFKSQNDAQEYFNSKGGSSTNNADKLDGSDHDGIVCETLP
jgi:micrococcal nuclease